jgi:hypothetical protein
MKKQVDFDETDNVSINGNVQSKIDFARQHKPLIFFVVYLILSGIGFNIYGIVQLIKLLF